MPSRLSFSRSIVFTRARSRRRALHLVPAPRAAPSTSGCAGGTADRPVPSRAAAVRRRRARESRPTFMTLSPARTASRTCVLIGSLAAASCIARRASVSFTPSISNMIRPGRTTHTHCSGAPLPLPIRVSCGFFVIGLSGNTRTQILPPRLMKRVIATRAASIWRSVIQHGSIAFSPKSPNDTSEPRHALPACGRAAASDT